LLKNPEDRFKNGMELQEYIILNSTLASKKEETNSGLNYTLQQQYDKVVAEKYEIQEALLHYQNASVVKDKKLDELEGIILMKDNELDYLKKAVTQSRHNVSGGRGVSRPAFIALLLLTIGLGALATYSLINNKKQVQAETNTPVRTTDSSLLTDNSNVKTIPETEQSNEVFLEDEKEPEATESTPINNSSEESDKQINSESKEVNTVKKEEKKPDDRSIEKPESSKSEGQLGEYKVISKAYFHNQPDEGTRRDAYILHWNNAILKPSEEKDGFVYIVFTNDQGQTSKGWLRKKDLIAVNQ
jgi:serine/threonine-protein kinase